MASASHSSTTPAEGSARARTGSVRVNTVKATVADQIAQSVQSTSNLLHLMQQSSSSHACLTKLPKNLLAKTSTIKNTEQLLEQMPSVISSLDAHVESGLQCVPHLKTVIQLLENMESCQLNPMSEVRLPEKEPEPRSQPSAPS